jgi:hypothetical protein
MRTQTEPHVEAIEFDEIEFKEMPISLWRPFASMRNLVQT